MRGLSGVGKDSVLGRWLMGFLALWGIAGEGEGSIIERRNG